jgi:hypothetical protein
MFTRILLYIKHNLKFIWNLIEWVNGLFFKILYGRKFKLIIYDVIREHGLNGYRFKTINAEDLKSLAAFIGKQSPEELTFFKPHEFDYMSLLRVFKNPAFLMMGVFDGEKIVGYFFLRCFWNKKCFVGRLIDKSQRGKGIGDVMNNIMYQIAWQMDFRCLSTISRNNTAVMNAHARNKSMVILKELPDDYLLVEFVKKDRET